MQRRWSKATKLPFKRLINPDVEIKGKRWTRKERQKDKRITQ